MNGIQIGGVLVLVMVTMSLLATATSWRRTGIINWRNVVTSVGIGLLGLAFVVQPRRPVLFFVLVGLSLMLVVVTLMGLV